MEAVCPNCQTPLPAQVTSSASSQVARCAGCGSLVLWANGRVVRATRPVEDSSGKIATQRPPALELEEPTRVDPERLKPPKAASLAEAKPRQPASDADRPGLDDNEPTMVRMPAPARDDSGPTMVRTAASGDEDLPTIDREPPPKSAAKGPAQVARTPAAAAKIGPNAGTVRVPAEEARAALAAASDNSGPTDISEGSTPAAPAREKSAPRPEAQAPREKSAPRLEAPPARKSSPKLPSLPAWLLEDAETKVEAGGAKAPAADPPPREKSAPRVPAVSPRDPSAPRLPVATSREKSAPAKSGSAAAKEPSGPRIPALPPRDPAKSGSIGASREKSAPRIPSVPPRDGAKSGPAAPRVTGARPIAGPPKPGATGDAPRSRKSTPPPVPGGIPSSDPAAGWLSALPGGSEVTAPPLTALAEAAATANGAAKGAPISQPPPAGDSTKSAALFGEPAIEAPLSSADLVALVPARKPRAIWIGGGAAGLLLLILGIALALHQGSPPPARPPEVAAPAPPPVQPKAPPPVVAVAPPPPVARRPAREKAAPVERAPKPPAEVARPAPPAPPPRDDTPPLTDGARAQSSSRHHHHHSKVVLDYDAASGPKPASSTPLPEGADDAVARARTLYRRGTEKLFAGDNSGAVRDYQAAIAAYPDYIGGYRGLGVGWERLNDAPRAIAAFNIYLRTVPNARDAPQIRQRIERLERKY